MAVAHPVIPAIMEDLRLTMHQYEKARGLGEGPVLCSYRDRGAICMETELGEDTFVWRNGDWQRLVRRAA